MMLNEILELAGKISLHDRGLDQDAARACAEGWIRRFSEHEMTFAALRLGYQAHGMKHQMRKYQEGVPYFVHPIAVAIFVGTAVEQRTIPERDKLEMISAALLHDVLEDTDLDEEEIVSSVGGRVAGLVFELTDEFTKAKYPTLNRSERKALENERIASISTKAMLVKLCDMEHNMRDIAKHDPDFGTIYLKEKKALIGMLWKKDWIGFGADSLGEVVSCELKRQAACLGV